MTGNRKKDILVDIYIYIYLWGNENWVAITTECRRVLTRGTATRRLHTNCLVIKGRLRKINSKRGEEIFVVTGSGNRPVSRGYRSSLSRAFVISIRPKRILPRPLSNPFFFLSLSLSFFFTRLSTRPASTTQSWHRFLLFLIDLFRETWLHLERILNIVQQQFERCNHGNLNRRDLVLDARNFPIFELVFPWF